MDRLWLFQDPDRYSRSKLFPPDMNRSKPDKPAKKGQKSKEWHKDIVKKMVSRLEQGGGVPFNFEAVLQNILLLAAVRPSIKMGLIHSNPFGKRFRGCPFSDTCSSHDKCFRHYSDPECRTWLGF